MGYRAHIATTLRFSDYTDGMCNHGFDRSVEWLMQEDVYVDFNGDNLYESNEWEINKDELRTALDRTDYIGDDVRRMFEKAVEMGDPNYDHVLIKWW